MKYELTKDLETGNAVIDSEHRQLFLAVNNMMEACSQGKGRSQMDETARFLKSYVDKHFKDEEDLQQKSAYPDYAAHKQFHEGYKRQLAAVIQEMTAQGVSIAILSKFNQVVGVLVNHIRMEDKKMAAHVNRS